jgi:hypothetical protein
MKGLISYPCIIIVWLRKIAGSLQVVGLWLLERLRYEVVMTSPALLL